MSDDSESSGRQSGKNHNGSFWAGQVSEVSDGSDFSVRQSEKNHNGSFWAGQVSEVSDGSDSSVRQSEKNHNGSFWAGQVSEVYAGRETHQNGRAVQRAGGGLVGHSAETSLVCFRLSKAGPWVPEPF